MDKLKSLRLFLTVIDYGNYSEAAKINSSSPSTISKAVLRLEKTVGIQLFQRSTRQLRLTSEGEEYAVKVRSILEELETCEYRIRHQKDLPHGKLRISCPVSYGRLYIRPLLKSFNQLYPKISIEMSYDDRHVDIIEQGYDLCIRSGTVTDSRLVAQQLSPIDFLICASPGYLQNSSQNNLRKTNPLKSVRDFDQHPWIRFRFQQTGRLLPIMMPGRPKPREYNPDQTYIVDDGEAMAELCADGLGLTQVPHFIGRNWLNTKKIVPLFPAFAPQGHGVYIMYPKRDFLPERVKVFVDYIKHNIEQQGETPNRTWAKDIKVWRA